MKQNRMGLFLTSVAMLGCGMAWGAMFPEVSGGSWTGGSSVRFDGRGGLAGHMVHGREWFGTADGAGGAWVETGEWEDGWRNLGEGDETTEVLALNGARIAVEGGRLTGNTTWGTDATHVLRHTVVVGSGQTLTVAAGAVVKVPHGASIRVEDGGRVHFAGIEGNEAVLTGVGDAEWGAVVDCGVWTNDGRATAFSLQSGAAQVTDDGGNVRFGFNPGDQYPTVKLQNGGGKRSDGLVRIPVAVVGTARTNAFRMDWEAVDGSAVFGEDYLLATGTVRWAKSAEGTKNIEIPVDAGRMRGSNVAFTVRVTAHYGCNAAADVAEAVIREFDFPQMQGGAWAGSAAVRFEGREGLAGAVVHGREWFGTADGEGGEWTETGEWADGWREIGDAGASARVLSLNAPEIAVEGGRLAESTTWESNATHLVRNTVVVGSGKTLTIGAGTVVKFLPGTVIKVEDGGKLALQGASGADVLLTSAQDGRFGAAIDCGEWEQETVGQDDGVGGIVLQSGSASFADNGWVETLSFRHGAYPYVKLNDTVAFRDGGMAYVPVSIASGSRAGAFSVDWVAVDGTAKFGEDYLLAGGTLSWTNTSQGTKTLQIPLGTDAVRGETTSFKLKLAVCRACNASGSGECTVTIRELDKIAFGGGTWSGSGAIRFDGRGSVAGRTVNGREWFGEPDGGDGRWTDTAAWGVGWKEIGSGEKTDVLSLNAPDIAVEGGRLAENTTWDSNAVHWVRHWVVVPSGKTLTLGPGAEVRLMDDAGIKLEDGGRLSVQGADGADVAILRGGAEALPEVPGDSGVVEGTAGRIWFQSGSATFADNGWFQAAGVGFSPTNYGSVSIHGAEASRKAGVAYVAVTVGGNARNAPFVVDWEAVPGTATEGRDYLLGGGRMTWNKSSEGTKWIAIPLNTETVAGERRSFTVRLKAVHGMAGTGREATVEIREYEEGDALSGRRGEVAFFEPSEPSAPFAVEEGIRLQPIFRNDAETVRYSGRWQEFDRDAAAALLVTLETDNGKETLKNALPSEEGGFDLDLAKYPVGHYTLKHDIIDGRGGTLATMEKVFSIVDRDDVELHGGALTQNETWTADKVHVVYQTVVVPSVYTLFIEPGTVVKFMTGAGIDIAQGGAFFANGIVFTHINDDTVGGDTLSDGYTVAPPMDAYYLTGAFTFGDDTELRGITQNTALTGTISGKKTLSRGSTYRVTGTLTIASGGDLTIPAGTVLKMESGASIVVNSGGTLNAPGTRAAPIVITSIKDDSYSGDTNKDGDKTVPQPGDWEEIKNNGGTVTLANVTALYGGYGQYSNQGDAIIRTASGETRLECCTVKHSDLRLIGRTGGTVYAENCILADGRWGIDGAVTFVNGVIADCNTGANGATLKNTILWACETYASGGSAANCVAWGETTAVQAGMAYADPFFVDPENGDFRIFEGSPCVDAADGEVAPETDFFGQPRITLTGGDSTNLVGQLPDIGICEVMPRDVTSDIDLVPRNVRTASNALPGQMLFVKWEVANAGGSELDAAWRDTVSLVSESGREVVLGDKTTASRIASGGSAFCSGYFTVPAIPEGTWYPKVNVNSYHDIFEGALIVNNALTGEDGVKVALEALDPAVAREGVVYGGAPTVLKLRFAAGNEDRMVKFRVPAGVKVSWGFGFVPQGSSQSGGTTAADGLPVQFLVPDAEGEMDVYVVLDSDTTESYALSTESTKLTVTGVTPGTLPSSGTTTLTITGAGFGVTNAVTLVGAGASICLQLVEQDASGNLVATVDCSLLAGSTTYTMCVGSDGREAELPDAVTVLKVEGRGILELEYDVPSSVRPGRVFSFTVTYRNTGNKDMCPPLLTVKDTGSDSQNPIQFSLDGERFTPGGFQFVGTDKNGGFGALRPGDEVTLAVLAKIPSANNGSTAVSVRANTESDIMAKYTTEIDRYLTPSMKAEFAATTNDELRVYGERLALLFGENNGEMVKNFAALAKRFYECNGFALRKVEELVSYGVTLREDDGAEDASLPNSTEAGNKLPPTATHKAVDDLSTGAYLYPDMISLNHQTVDLSDVEVAIIAHGMRDGYWKSAWMKNLAGALVGTGKFKHVVCIDWHDEADTLAIYPWGASKHIGEVAWLVAGSLKRCQLVPSNTTLIGHSFGSHLLGHMARKHFSGETFKRHIGLDTAATSAISDSFEVKGNEAQVTEYYRSSSGSGRNDPYAKYNYMVCKRGSFDLSNPSTDPFVGAHAYSHDWFVDNVRYGEGSGIGFWREDSNKGGGMLPANGFIGIIYGPLQKLECIYPYQKQGNDVSKIYYPGNKAGWLDMRAAWVNTYDLQVKDAKSVENAEFKTGIPRRLNVNVGDVCDILTIDRLVPFYRVAVSVSDLDGSNVRELVTLPCQPDTHFDFELALPHDCITGTSQEKQIRFTVSAEDLLGNQVHELYEGDNTAAYKITVRKGDGPEAAINGYRQNNFVIDRPVYFASEEEYAKAYAENETFVYTYDGRASKAMAGSQLVKFEWYDSESDEPTSEDSVYKRMYYKVSRGDYPIQLVVTDDLGRSASIKGILRVHPEIGKGKPIEQPRSYDPNEMSGPLGAGERRLVAPGEWMTYTVYFENKSDATAAAQEVYVTEALGGALDWSTFEMVDVGFNNQLELGLVGKRKGASETAMTGTAYKVRTELDYSAKTGAAKWYMRIVDESTETRWPRDVYAGFLPPNDATGRGEGHITYRVKLRDDAAAGTVVRASASIVFDYNAAIETDPAWWNTVAEMGTATVDLGNGVETNVTVMVGAPWEGQLPDPGKRQGMRFAGWFTGPDGTGEEVTAESVAAAGAKLYAFWDATAAPELWLDVSWGAVEIGTNGVVKGYGRDGEAAEGMANRYVLTGTSRVNGVKFAGGSFTNTWTNLVIGLDAKDAVAVTLEGASVEVTLEGDNSIASGEDCAGVRVDAASALVLQGEGRLAAQGGKCGAGIGGGKLQESGRVEIHAGTVEARGGEYGAGIGGGLVAPAAGAVVIAGGSVKARGSEGGEDIGGGFGREGTGAPVGAAGTPVHEVEVPLATDALPAEVVVDLGGGETYRYAGPGHVGDTSLWFWLPDGTYEFAADGDEYGAHVAGTNAAAVFTDPGNANFVAPPVGEVSSEGSAMRAAMDPAYRTSPFEVWTATGLKGHAWDWTPVPPGGYDWDATNAVIRIPDGTNRTRVLRLKFLKR